MSDAEARAGAARRLLDDPMLKEAFANVREAAVDEWRRSSAADVQKREFAYLTNKAVDRIEAELSRIIDNGAIAARRVQAPVR